MDTRTSRYAARLVETGWLAAVIAVPVFFDVWSNRVFEPDKLTFLRTLALLMTVGLVAWFVERREPGQSWRDRLSTPLVLPVLLLTAVYAFASALSVVRGLSVFGSYQRLQGLYTWMAYVTLFVSVLALLRRRGQLDRLLLAVVVPSLPVSLYGVIQSRGLDPMPWLGDVVFRVASTMGNSIFVAAYVIIVVPLTIVKVIESLRAIEPEVDDSSQGGGSALSAAASAPVMRAAAYMVLLFVQVVCLVLAQSRGPWLGIGGALFVMAMCGAALRPGLSARRRWSSMTFIGLGVVPAVALLAFNLAPAGSSLAELRDVRYLGRLGQVLETDAGTGKVRVLIWQGAIDMITSDPKRFVVGYGPESMHVAYNPYYPPDLAHYESRNASPDRSHNETLDWLAATGLLGFVAYLALFTALFAYALRWLGLIDNARQRNAFLGFWLAGGVLAVAAARAWSGGWTFFGVALPAGMIAGLVTFVFARALSSAEIPQRPARLLVLGLTAALVAHFIEIHFGIAIAATRTLFFVLAATLVVVGGFNGQRPALLAPAGDSPRSRQGANSGPAPRSRRARRARRPQRSEHGTADLRWSSYALVMLLLLVTMAFDFLVRGFAGESSVGTQELMVLGWLFSLTWAVGSLILGGEALLADPGAASRIGRYVLTTLGGLGLYAVIHMLLLGGGRGGAGTSSSLLALYYVTVIGLMLVWSWRMSRAQQGEPLSRLGALWLYPVAGLAVLVVAFFTNYNEVRADIYYKEAWQGYHTQANNYLARGDSATAEAYFESALRSYDRAIELDHSEDYYMLFKGKALLEQADGEAQALADQMAAMPVVASEYDEPELAALVQSRDRAFEKAVSVLSDALALAPLNTDHYANLGRAYQVWGERTHDEAARAERLQSSLDWFDKAIELSPKNAGLRTEQATTAFLAGDDEAAIDRIQQALELDSEYGRPYRLRATIRREAGDWEAAEEDYRKYVESRDGRSDAVGWSGLAYVLGQQGKTADAIDANEQVLELAGDDLATLRNLVLLYRDSGDAQSACAYIERAAIIAPEDTSLAQLAVEIGCTQAAAEDDLNGESSAPETPAGEPTASP